MNIEQPALSKGAGFLVPAHTNHWTGVRMPQLQPTLRPFKAWRQQQGLPVPYLQ